MDNNVIISFEEFLKRNAGKIPLVYNTLSKKAIKDERKYFLNKHREISTLYNSAGYLKDNPSFPLCKFDIFEL